MGFTIPNLFGSLSASGQGPFGDLVSEAQCCSCHQLTLSHKVVSSWSFTLFISLLNVLWEPDKERGISRATDGEFPRLPVAAVSTREPGVPCAPP